MTLPWFRVDSGIATHDKVLRLLAEREGYRAFTVYICSMGYAAQHGTDGFIPRYALPHLHGTDRHAQLLVEARLWNYADGGWEVHNWTARQELAVVTEAKRQAQRLGARRTNCVRYHGKDCGCWKDDKDDGGSILPLKGRR